MDYPELEKYIGAHFPGYEGDIGAHFKKMLDIYITPGCSLLEIGCGRQVFGSEYYSRAAKKVGIDLEAEAIKENETLDSVVCGSIEHMPFPDNSFDIVIAQWVLEHVADAAKTAKEVARVLKPGGVFLFITPNAWSPFVIVTRFVPISLKKSLRKRFLSIAETDTFPTHYRMNTIGTLNKLFASVLMKPEITKLVDCFTYFKFSKTLVWLSVLGARIMNTLHITVFRHHLVGVYKK
jgi:ubiquinone/menaquinone biosynthesis C-methylase UbiE